MDHECQQPVDLEARTSLPEPVPPISLAPAPTAIPKQIGHYAVKQRLASGGMGTVYLAVQEQPRRTVALKVMRSDLSSQSVLRRFEYEAQILARLRHPNIAAIYEAGTHDSDGRPVPYFAMEYVPNARTVTEYVREHDLSVADRLALFSKICSAIHHGHQKGIIHRDVKPGNILVDSEGEPKIIDFGVARATDSDLAVTTLQTDLGQLIGTVQYMSPEQCAADPHDLDTRSDVYSLGVVLYEVLCERLPYDVTKSAIHEAARIVRDETPARPSSISTILGGDVETIALKALEKNRRRRYQSASDLGQDIDRYLRKEPIEARPPSVVYQLRMFSSRHRTTVVAAVAVVLALVIGTIAMAIGFGQARSERDEATSSFEKLRDVTSMYLLDLDPTIRKKGATEARKEFVAEALGAVEHLADGKPPDPKTLRLIASLYDRIGAIQGGKRGDHLGDHPAAASSHEKALAIRRQLHDAQQEDQDLRAELAATMMHVADVQELLPEHDPDRVLQLHQESVGIKRALVESAPAGLELQRKRQLAIGLISLADIYRKRKDPRASKLIEESLEYRKLILEDAEGPEEIGRAEREITVLRGRVAYMLMEAEQFEEAIEQYREILATRQHIATPTREARHDVMITRYYLGDALVKGGQFDEAAEHLTTAIATAQRLIDEDPTDRRVQRDLALPYWAMGDLHAAARDVAKATEAYREAERILAPYAGRSKAVAMWLEKIRTALADLTSPPD